MGLSWLIYEGLYSTVKLTKILRGDQYKKIKTDMKFKDKTFFSFINYNFLGLILQFLSQFF